MAQRYVQPARLCISGRSAGGLLMGAVLNMRPDLFHAAIIGACLLVTSYDLRADRN